MSVVWGRLGSCLRLWQSICVNALGQEAVCVYVCGYKEGMKFFIWNGHHCKFLQGFALAMEILPFFLFCTHYIISRQILIIDHHFYFGLCWFKFLQTHLSSNLRRFGGEAKHVGWVARMLSEAQCLCNCIRSEIIRSGERNLYKNSNWQLTFPQWKTGIGPAICFLSSPYYYSCIFGFIFQGWWKMGKEAEKIPGHSDLNQALAIISVSYLKCHYISRILDS